METYYNNLVDAVNSLVQEGYTDDFKLLENSLRCEQKGIDIQPGDFVVDAVYRFEEDSDPTENSILYAISSPKHQLKGLLIDAYGVYENQDEHPILSYLQAQATVQPHQTDDPDGYKYGVPKVLKAEFDAQPDRFELRKDFPDFPSCPWGNSFHMLGYDKQDQKYVWLVKSILKDERLQTVDYQN